MNILVIGSGGREHALGWTLARSPRGPRLFFAPGNAGTGGIGTNVDIAADDHDGLVSFVRSSEVDLTVVGPEQPLVDGLVDRFEREGLPVVGPTAAAARLEGSKEYAKDFMHRYGIPTARHRVFTHHQLAEALAYARQTVLPVVVKADGLAAGKGVVVCETTSRAEQAVEYMLSGHGFGDAGRTIVIEEFLEGEEASVFALTDGSAYVLFSSAQDHKRVGEGDTGPNTGGMGAYAPAPVVTPQLLESVKREIIEPTLDGMRQEGHPYRGFLYCGLMVLNGAARVVEFNCRMGDPEAQVVLPLLASDLAEALEASATGRLDDVSFELAGGSAACVVLASSGYPGAYRKGLPIAGLDQADSRDDTVVFHAGTTEADEGIVTNGGRVLAVTGTGPDLETALERAYGGVDHIDFEGKQFRRDIGQKGLRRLREASG